MSAANRRLSPETLSALPADVARPGYDRAAQRSGIVHFGIGAFHRAHQAVYTDDAMIAGDRDWGIVGVSLRSPTVARQLEPQRGLYSVQERGDAGERTRVIGAVQRVLVAPEAPEAVIAAIASPDTNVISFTVTEKGYHRTVQGALDIADPLVASDLNDGGVPRTIYGFLRHGLARRRAAGLPGVTLLSCDNLSGNGAILSTGMQTFLDRADPGLTRWFAAECACPPTMVDRIVPATTAGDLDGIARTLGVVDQGAVVTEPYRQWVIEDRFAARRPRWGASFVDDVRTYETAKLRLLNGAHSALAYLGLLAGHAFVYEAIADPRIGAIVDRLMRAEAATTLPAAPGTDWMRYCDALIERFRNQRLQHSLTQIAADGSQKIPQRWLAPLAEGQRDRRQFPATLTALAAWIVYVRGDRFTVVDPLAEDLANVWTHARTNAVAAKLFGEAGLLANQWTASEADLAFLAERIK